MYLQTGRHPLAERQTSVAGEEKGGLLEEQRTPSARRRRWYSLENSRVRSDIFIQNGNDATTTRFRWILSSLLPRLAEVVPPFSPCRRRNSRNEHRDNKTGLLKNEMATFLRFFSFFLSFSPLLLVPPTCEISRKSPNTSMTRCSEQRNERKKKRKKREEKTILCLSSIRSLDTTASRYFLYLSQITRGSLLFPRYISPEIELVAK